MMQRRSVVLVVWLVSALLALSGCDKLKELTGGEPAKESAAKEEPRAEEPVVEAEAPEEEAPEEEAPKEAPEEPAAEEPKAPPEDKPELELPSRESFIEVSVVIGCNDLDRTLDLAQRTDLRRQALNQYGFIEETWEQAQQKFKDDPTVRPVLEGRVTAEACASKPEAAVKPPPQDRTAPISGIFRGAVKGGGVRGTIMLSLKPGRLSGNVKGTRDGGEKWAVGLNGDMRGATFSGAGKNKNTNLRVQGRVDGAKASGTLSGTINGKNASATFTANR